jgi:rare lipoprotein A
MERGQRWARTATLAVLLSCAGLGPLAAQTHRPAASQFEDVFRNPGRADPTFTRPDVTRHLPLPAPSDQSAPTTQAQSASVPKQPRPEARPSKPSTTAAVSARRKQAVAARGASDRGRTGIIRHRQARTGSRAKQTVRVTQAAKRPAAQHAFRAARPTVNRQGQLGGGRAVWYQHPGRTASGEKFNPSARTAAHKTLPLGTRVRVVNKHNSRSVVVRINDRMPAKAKGVIDLSRGSARALDIDSTGSVALKKAK